MINIHATTLTVFVTELFRSADLPEQNATLVANSLVSANLAGHDSHGVVRAPNYLKSVASGDLDPVAEPTITQETGVVTMIDANRGFGQVAAKFSITQTIHKARQHGLAATGLFNCGHVGRLGEWVTMAAEEKMIGLAFCNGGRTGGLVAPHGGAARRLGTNPFAAAVPGEDQPPVVIDFATSFIAEGKVRVAMHQGKSIPEGAILDANGQPSTTPQDLYNGGMLLPIGGHKGFCLSMLMDLMGGVLTGAGSPMLPGYTVFGNGVLFLVLSIEAFRPLDAFLANSAQVSGNLKDTPPVSGVDEVRLPGEPERRTTAHRLANGIPMAEMTWESLVEAANELGVDVPEEVG